jgi:hypothetical protein
MTLLPTPTWDTFLRTVSTRTNGTWLFRGQAAKKWPLSPSAGRDQCVGSAGYRRADEYNLVKDFIREAKRYVESGFSELEWLALAQHHGLPTRLLDWSTNPLVAAWFACEKEENTDDSVVHMSTYPRWTEGMMSNPSIPGCPTWPWSRSRRAWDGSLPSRACSPYTPTQRPNGSPAAL